MSMDDGQTQDIVMGVNLQYSRKIPEIRVIYCTTSQKPAHFLKMSALPDRRLHFLRHHGAAVLVMVPLQAIVLLVYWTDRRML
jgi:hypothetical protein